MPSVVAARSLLEQAGPLDEEPLTLRRHGMHSGSDILAWRDLRRIVEKVLRTAGDAHFAALLREQRAVTSGGLAFAPQILRGLLRALRTRMQSRPRGT